ncbi:MAG: diaminopimelate decarboxylase [Chitinophagia bacterium]|jgi:diaminopimelate decarboxylase|nr:diaminopimelate decarboxylase [Chitinophagia bacterium]NCA29611.1 diaminopimelate decarboxylase [Chitinophagia bacterium]NDD16955.1 diaminopimelate decarboxylase [Chitinophagia bacterium]
MNPSLTYEELNKAANTYGTPLYVYHGEKIEAQYQNLLTHFSNKSTRFFYASKALTNIHILNLVKKVGCNIDCSSINEVKLAMHVGFHVENILYTSNSVAFEEIKEVVSLGVHVNIDSLSNLEKFGAAFGNRYPVGIRIRPDIMAGGNLKISTGHNKSKFGIPFTEKETLKNIQKKYGINISALHIHTGSEIKDVAVFLESAKVFEELLPDFPTVNILDFGGGFKVPYMPEEKGTDIALLGAEVNKIMEKLSAKMGRNLTAWFEPGKYLVSESGYFITQVNVLKKSGDIEFAGINSGLNHLIRPMFYDAYHHIINISAPHKNLKNYAVVGNICETDTFAWDRPIASIEEGDYLVFFNAGAYGYEMSSNYNARYKPAQVLYKNGKATLISRADTFEDLLRLQTPLS